MPKLVEHAVEIKKLFEKCVLTAYMDSGKVWTIGWGHTSDSYFPVKEGMTITQEKANELALHDLAEAEIIVKRDIITAYLNDFQYSALVDIAFNCGRFLTKRGEAWKPSDLMIALNEGKYDHAAVLMLTYKIKDRTGTELLGLKRRRLAEQKLFTLDEHTQILAKDWARQVYDEIYKVKK